MKSKVSKVLSKLNNKKLKVVVLILLILLLLLLIIKTIIDSNTTLKCRKENEIIEGFNNSEKITIKYNLNGKIKNIKTKQSIKLNDYYKQKKTYINTLENIFRSAYSDIGDYKITSTEDKIEIKVNTKKGIVLNNITITQNGNKDTNLRFDTLNNLDSEYGIKVGSKISKAELKNKLKKVNYICK